jgi:membrane-bound lytic murein transglycosylase MltF
MKKLRKNNNVSLTYLLLESVAEQNNIKEGKFKNFIKRNIVPYALGAASTVAVTNNNIKDKIKDFTKTTYSKSIEKEKGIDFSEILTNQVFKESEFDPNAKSPKGAKGLTQIMPSALADYAKSIGKKPEDVNLNDKKQSMDIHIKTMKDLYNAEFIKKNNPSQIVRIAKTLVSYNWGRGNASSFFNKLKKEGYDIYNSLEWVEKLPKEPRDYVNAILLKKDSKFNRRYDNAIKNKNNLDIIKYYQKIKDLDK